MSGASLVLQERKRAGGRRYLTRGNNTHFLLIFLFCLIPPSLFCCEMQNSSVHVEQTKRGRFSTQSGRVEGWETNNGL